MKNNISYKAIIILFAIIAVPGVAMAQVSGTVDTEINSNYQGYHQQQNELQQKIAALGGTADTYINIPILFGVAVKNISPNFGNMSYVTNRTHAGEDIMAVKGTPIVSPTAAVVTRVSPNLSSSEGNAVYTMNPGGEEFVYYHLDRIGEGVVRGSVLAQGSLIGYVGNTGTSAVGVASHLHLEIYNSAGVATDPFPRLALEFTPAQKISFLTTILGQTSDPKALSQLLVTNFRSTFTAYIQGNIILPQLIMDALGTVPVLPPAVGNLPAGDLTIGTYGSAVTSLQQFLITKAIGSASVRLAQAGATGYFGFITKAALVEYQIYANISPADGYYGPSTRALVEVVSVNQPPVAPPSGVLVITKNLYYGVSDQEVLTLQKFLNAKGFVVAVSGGGSLGNETIFFGPATRSAVIKFQLAYNISPAIGYVGPITRAVIASINP